MNSGLSKKAEERGSSAFFPFFYFHRVTLASLVIVSVFIAFFAQYLAPAGMSAFDFRRWVGISLLIAVLLLFVSGRLWPRQIELPLAIGLSIFLMSAFYSTFTGFTVGHDFVECLYWLALSLAVCSLTSWMNESSLSDRAHLSIGFVFISLIVAFLFLLLVIFLYILFLLGGELRFEPITLMGFANIRYWSHLATILLPVFPVALIYSRSFQATRMAWLAYIVMGGFWWLVFVTTSRGTIASILVAGLLVAIIFRGLALDWLKITLVSVVIGAIVYLFLSIIFPNLLHDQESTMRSFSTSSSGRLDLWVETVRNSFVHFPFGTGSMGWVRGESQALFAEYGGLFSHPHNMYLLWAYEYGWLSIVGASIVFVSAIRRLLSSCLRLKNKERGSVDSNLVIGFSVSIIASVLHSGLSMVYLSPSSALLLIFIVPIFWSLTADANLERPDSLKLRSAWGRATGYGFGALFSLLLISMTFNYYADMKRDEKGFRENIYNGFSPRFWMHGQYPR